MVHKTTRKQATDGIEPIILTDNIIPEEFSRVDQENALTYCGKNICIEVEDEFITPEIYISTWNEHWMVGIRDPVTDQLVDQIGTTYVDQAVAERVSLGEMRRLAEGANNDTIEMNHQTVEELLEYACQNEPTCGWTGDLATAIVDAKTTLYDDIVEIDRGALFTLANWADRDSATDVLTSDSPVKMAIRKALRAAHNSDSEIAAFKRSEAKALLECVKEDPALDHASPDDEICRAIRQVEDEIDHSDPLCGSWKRADKTGNETGN